jgi:hypothetical protein
MRDDKKKKGKITKDKAEYFEGKAIEKDEMKKDMGKKRTLAS